MPSEKTVLVVDDEPHIRGFLGLVLEHEGYRVEMASDGCEALTKARTLSPDAVVLDLLMPVLDGAGFLREWGAIPACDGVPVLAMSAGDAPVHPEAIGVRDVLVKPFDLDMLLRKLASVL